MASHRQDRSSKINRSFKHLFLSNRFFIALAFLVLGLILSFIFPAFFIVMQILVGASIAILLLDFIALFRIKEGVYARRIVGNRLSNGDKNKISIEIDNLYPFAVNLEIIEEAPFQFQERKLIFNHRLNPKQTAKLNYDLRPTRRGIYQFGAVNIFVAGVFGLLTRRYSYAEHKTVSVYPAFLEMNKFELMASSNRLTEYGVKRVRRLGNATNFEHIKQYVVGDDTRTINYKATARSNELMVNTYEEERSQPIYCVIDKGRTMKMPFEGLSLLDYAINSSLIISNTALTKGDKAGIITFSNTIDDVLVADNKVSQRNLILERLFAQKTNYLESDYAKLYLTLKRVVKQRSLIILYTNFETLNGMDRQLRYLRLIAKDHLLVIAFFINTEIENIVDNDPQDIEDVFVKAMAENFSNDKLVIVNELKRYGIHTVLAKPEGLSINSVNKYLELKARGSI